MRYLASHEKAVRGTFDFPIQLYYVDAAHPRYEMPFHWHMEHELILVLQGVLHLSADGTGYNLGPGDCVLLADGCIHGGRPENCVYECVVFDLERFLTGAGVCGQQLAALLQTGARLEAFFAAGSQAAELVSGLFQAMETERPGYEFTTIGLLWQLLGEMLAHRLYRPALAEPARDSRRSQAVKQVLRRIRTAYAQPLTLAQLAAEAALEPKYFCRVFRQITGRTLRGPHRGRAAARRRLVARRLAHPRRRLNGLRPGITSRAPPPGSASRASRRRRPRGSR